MQEKPGNPIPGWRNPPLSPATPDDSPPRIRFGHYEICHRDGKPWELGRGGMGITYKALDVNLNIKVALKVVLDAHVSDEHRRSRFRREARAAARIRHPNVAGVFHLGEEQGVCFYAMEFIEGETLGEFVRREGALDLRPALEIVSQVAAALNVAARHGLVHRDIKPSNLMLVGDPDQDISVKVIDFGLVKDLLHASEASLSLTQGGFVGTLYFASPEQVDGGEVDTRSDIYSLGVTLWFMLTGRPLFHGTALQVATAHLSHPLPYDTLGKVASQVRPLLERMLAKNPANRLQTAAELRCEVNDCLRALDETPISVAGVSPGCHPLEDETESLVQTQSLRPFEKVRRFRSLHVGLTFLAVMLAVTAFWLLVYENNRPSDPTMSPAPFPEIASDKVSLSLPTDDASPVSDSPPVPAPAFSDIANLIESKSTLSMPEIRDGAEPASRLGTAEVKYLEAEGLLYGNDTVPDVPKAVSILQSLADEGYGPAANLLATAYDHGTGVKADPAKALALYQRAAELGDLEGMANLGTLYSKGSAVLARDPQKGAALLKRSADAGNPTGMLQYGITLMEGINDERQEAEGAKLIGKAAEAGFPAAMYAWGLLHAKGWGVPKNSPVAKRWIQAAANAGDARAQEWLQEAHAP